MEVGPPKKSIPDKLANYKCFSTHISVFSYAKRTHIHIYIHTCIYTYIYGSVFSPTKALFTLDA